MLRYMVTIKPGQLLYYGAPVLYTGYVIVDISKLSDTEQVDFVVAHPDAVRLTEPATS